MFTEYRPSEKLQEFKNIDKTAVPIPNFQKSPV